MSDKMLLALIVIFLLTSLSLINELFNRGEKQTQQHYCEMVALWHRMSDLPPDQRIGWPPYKGLEGCDGGE